MNTHGVVTNNDSSISEISRHCLLSFAQCLRNPTLMEYEWAENRLAEYKLWAAGNGVFASSNASLDARLIVEWETKHLIINMLILLQGCIEKCNILATTPGNDALAEQNINHATDPLAETDDSSRNSPIEAPVRSFSPWSDASSEADEAPSSLTKPSTGVYSILAKCKDEVEQIIDLLGRISAVIRKGDTSSRAFLADRQFKPNDHDELRQHLELVILSRGCEQGREYYSADDSLLTPIQRRLIMTNLRRRNRFLYAQRHAQKLAFDAGTALPTDQVKLNTPAVPKCPVGQAQPLGVTAALTPLTTTAASAINVVNPAATAQQLSYTPSKVAETNITVTTAKVSYPRPPKLKDGLRYFRCPACCQVLPEMFQQTTLWREHLMTDISPYTCVVDDCAHAEQMYTTRNAWKKHIQEEHQKCWVCHFCTEPGHIPLVFPSSRRFLLHIQTTHANTTNEDQFAALLSESQAPVPLGISSCPLCDKSAQADSAALLDHIAEHMHEFSLRSLPWPSQKLPDDPDSAAPRDYFLAHEYFGEDSDKLSAGTIVDGPDSSRDTDGLSTNLSFIDEPTDRSLHQLRTAMHHYPQNPEGARSESSAIEIAKEVSSTRINADFPKEDPLEHLSSPSLVPVRPLNLKIRNIQSIQGKHDNSLLAASISGNIDLVQFLIEYGADVNIEGGQFGNPLQAASLAGYINIVRLLIEHGANVNMQGGEYGSPLQAACVRGYIAIVRLLIEHGANVNIQGGECGSPLQAACVGGDIDTSRLLIEHGADVNIQDGECGSPLQAASVEDYINTVRLLIEHGADVNIQGGKYGSPLRVASSAGYIDIVRLLIENGADVDMQGGEYGSPLQVASLAGHIDIGWLLIEHLSDENIRDAIAQLESVLKIQETTFQEGHPFRLASQYNLAKAYLTNGRSQDAIALLEQIAEIQKESLHKGHWFQQASLRELGKAYRATGRSQDAIALQEQIAEIQKESLHKDRWFQQASLRELAKAYRATGRSQDAIALQEQIAEIQKENLNEDASS